MKKKIIYIVILVVAIITVIGFFAFLSANNVNNEKTTNTVATVKQSNTSSKSSSRPNTSAKATPRPQLATTVTEMEDGTLYSVTEDEVKSDIVIGDNYFDTQVNNMMTNPSDYTGKVIEIEGMYLAGELDPVTLSKYTFVGRYSTSNMCAYCPTGYSYMEFEWNGDALALTDEQSWIKVKGTLNLGYDGTTPYYYIDAQNIEVMNERGIDTVNN